MLSDERSELAKLCASRNWSKAIRVLDSLLSQSFSIQDICNRAFCYSKLELHKHVIKDCDKAIQIDPTLLRAYILKGNALKALGRKEEACLVWREGYEISVCEPTDLKQLMELEELVDSCVRSVATVPRKHNVDEPPYDMKVVMASSPCDTKVVISEDPILNSSDTSDSATQMKVVVFEDQQVNRGASDCGIQPIMSDKIDNIKDVTNNQASGLEETCSSLETIKKDQKPYVAKISKTKSISLDIRLSRGIAQVNEGNYNHAISIFDQILRETPTYSEALIGRGTAFAFQRELESAIADFSSAVRSNPSAGEAWKRRGQARAALSVFPEAIEDLSKALEFEPNSPDILHERGIVYFKSKDYDAAIIDLSGCLKRDKKNASAHTFLGLALSAIGEYKQAEDEHLLSIKYDENFLDSWCHLAQLYIDLANPEKALDCFRRVILNNSGFAKGYHLRGLLYHSMGQHRMAITEFTKSLNYENTNIESLYLRGSCYHAIGEYKAAAKDYDNVLEFELDSMDKFVIQCLAFYQKEMALYTASKVNLEFSQFNIDDDIHPLFKEYWCKKLHPKDVCEKVYRQPPLGLLLKGGKVNKQDFKFTKHQIALIQAADSIGKKIQYYSPGFLPNKRQYRMAGLAAIEIAQKVSKAWRSLRNPKNIGKIARRREKLSPVSQNRGNSCCSTSTSSGATTSFSSNEDKNSGSSLQWLDVYSIAVKWRQISEPCDPVVWVNKLGDEFNLGFGSHTPILLGQSKVVRYYPNFQRVFDSMKRIMSSTQRVHTANDGLIYLSENWKLEKITTASSCADLFDLVGENFWVPTSCDSVAFEGKRLEGTRITIQKKGKLGFDFAIRTPCTPARWEEYEEEMSQAWEALCETYCSGDAYASQDLVALETVQNAILRLTYYWYNFMPLSRGSAAVGYIVMLGIFLAANMDVTSNIPPGVQVDWEAILSSSPDEFTKRIKGWLYPSIKINKSWKDHGDVSALFRTTGSVVAALSS